MLKIFKSKRKSSFFLFNTLNNQLFVSGSNVLSIALATRILGLEKFGIFSIAWAILLISNNLLNATFLTPLLSIVPKLNKLQKGNYLNNSFFLLSIFCVINSFVCFLIFSFFGENIGLINVDTKFSFFFSLSIIFTLFYDYSRRVFYVLRQMGQVFKLDILRYGIQISLLLIIYSKGLKDINLVICCFTISSFAALIICKKSIHFFPLKVKDLSSTIIRNYKMSKWLIPSAVIYWFNINIFTIFSGILLGPSSAGVLVIMQKLYAPISISLQGLENWGQVESSRILATKGFEELNQFLKKLFLVLFIISCIVVLIVNGNFVLISNVIFDVDLSDYQLEIFIYSTAVIFNTINQPFKYFANALENTKTNFIAELTAVLVVSISGYTLIKNYELVGALIGIGIMKLSILIVYFVVYSLKRLEKIERI